MVRNTYFVTGASGLLGRELIRRITAAEPEAQIYALVRTPPPETAHAGRAGAHEGDGRGANPTTLALPPRVVTIPGDLTTLRLGLARHELERLGAEVTHVIHSGASVRFDQPLASARRVNVFGTLQVLECAATMKRLERFVHVSTAYVAGDLRGMLLESPAKPGPFRNAYEQSKFEAEEALRARMTVLPITIVRPSIIAPAVESDAHAYFMALVSLYVLRGWRWAPGLPSSLVDLVPADLVAHAIHRLAMRRFAEGRWYHLAAGPRAATVRQLGTIAAEIFGCRPLVFLKPRVFQTATRTLVWGPMRQALERVAAYLPYLSILTRIDTTDSRRVLRELGIELPYSAEYFRRFLQVERHRAEAAQEGLRLKRWSKLPPAIATPTASRRAITVRSAERSAAPAPAERTSAPSAPERASHADARADGGGGAERRLSAVRADAAPPPLAQGSRS